MILVACIFIAGSAFAQDVPYEIEQKIKEIYASKYPDDYSMQKILIQDQLESYQLLKNLTYIAGVPQDILYKLKRIYLAKYPYDYSMQKILIQDQIKSYKELQ